MTMRVFALLAVLFPLSVHAACPEHFAGGVPPSSTMPVVELCSQIFAVGYAPADHEALWSAEHLTAVSIAQAEHLHGRGQFHEDLRLPVEQRSEPYDYKRSGWSRGHLTPSGDAPTRASREETFALSNIVPQATRLNEGAWSHIEINVRQLARQAGEVHVVTGPAFREGMGRIGADHVRVPSSLWKAVYVPSRHAVAVIVCKNIKPFVCNAVGLESLSRVTGIDPFPGVPAENRKRMAQLERKLLSSITRHKD
ncbi:DNA/RNA non-specific endonuclease [Acetobacter estunensis]|nr:DNA/RNA non-specific endonuclease [Acetobacter estunensis]